MVWPRYDGVGSGDERTEDPSHLQDCTEPRLYCPRKFKYHREDNKSGYPGVAWVGSRGSWGAFYYSIQDGKKNRHAKWFNPAKYNHNCEVARQEAVSFKMTKDDEYDRQKRNCPEASFPKGPSSTKRAVINSPNRANSILTGSRLSPATTYSQASISPEAPWNCYGTPEAVSANEGWEQPPLACSPDAVCAHPDQSQSHDTCSMGGMTSDLQIAQCYAGEWAPGQHLSMLEGEYGDRELGSFGGPQCASSGDIDTNLYLIGMQNFSWQGSVPASKPMSPPHCPPPTLHRISSVSATNILRHWKRPNDSGVAVAEKCNSLLESSHFAHSAITDDAWRDFGASSLPCLYVHDTDGVTFSHDGRAEDY